MSLRWRFAMWSGQRADLLEAASASAADQRRAVAPSAACWMVRHLARPGVLAAAPDAGPLRALLERATGYRPGFRELPQKLASELEAALRSGRVILVELPAPIGHVPLLSDPVPATAPVPAPEQREEPAALVAFADFDEPMCAECGAEIDGPPEMDVSAAAEPSSEQAGATGA